MHAASACGHWRVVNFLLSNNADILAANADGELPVDIADGEKVESILKEEIARRGLNETGLTEARNKAQVDLLAAIGRLVSEGQSVNQPDRLGVTPVRGFFYIPFFFWVAVRHPMLTPRR